MFRRGHTGMWRTASAPRAWAKSGHSCRQLCGLLMGEIVATQCPYSGWIRPLLVPAAAPAPEPGPGLRSNRTSEGQVKAMSKSTNSDIDDHEIFRSTGPRRLPTAEFRLLHSHCRILMFGAGMPQRAFIGLLWKKADAQSFRRRTRII
jgi:hypothetical protein